MGYIRSSGDHHHSSIELTTMAELTAGQQIQLNLGRWAAQGSVFINREYTAGNVRVPRLNSSVITVTKIAD